MTSPDTPLPENEPERMPSKRLASAKNAIRVRFEIKGAYGFEGVGCGTRMTEALQNKQDAQEVFDYLLGLESPGPKTTVFYPMVSLYEKMAAASNWINGFHAKTRRRWRRSPDPNAQAKHQKNIRAIDNLKNAAAWVIDDIRPGIGHPDRSAARVIDSARFLAVAFPRLRAARTEHPAHYLAGLTGMQENGRGLMTLLATTGDGTAIRDLLDKTTLRLDHAPHRNSAGALDRELETPGVILLENNRPEALDFIRAYHRLSKAAGRPHEVWDNLFSIVLRAIPVSLSDAISTEIKAILLGEGFEMIARHRSSNGASPGYNALPSLKKMASLIHDNSRAFGAWGLLRDPDLRPLLAESFKLLVENGRIELADTFVPLLSETDILEGCSVSDTLKKKKNGSVIWAQKRLNDVAGRVVNGKKPDDDAPSGPAPGRRMM